MDKVEWTILVLFFVLVCLCSVAITWTMAAQANCEASGGVPYRSLCLAPEALLSVHSAALHTNCEQNEWVDK